MPLPDPIADVLHQLRNRRDLADLHNRIRADRKFAAEVEWCWTTGTPLSILHGRPMPVPGLEPYFTVEDRATVAAYQEWRSMLCPGCGTHPLDWPTEEGQYYDVETRTCWPCVLLAETREDVRGKGDPNTRDHVHTFLVQRFPEDLAAD